MAMLETAAEGPTWGVLALRGLLALVFAAIAFISPGITLAALVFVFGAYALVDGVFGIVVGARGANFPALLSGILGVLAGLVALLWPGITAVAFLYVIAAWAFFTGCLEIAAGFKFRRTLQNEWLLILSGALSIILSLLLAAFPMTGILTVVWLFGFYAFLYGVLLMASGLKLRERQAEFRRRAAA